jgi:hypothetical protein
MEARTVAEAHRRCALLLAPLHRRDQSALLAALPPTDAAVVRQVLSALLASSLPIDAVPAGWLDAETPERTAADSDISIDWNALAGRVSPTWLARTLACVHGAEREFCLAALEPASRAAVAPLLANMPALPSALEASLRRRLLNAPEAG